MTLLDYTERWLPAYRWEGFYEVSDLGRVRSIDRWVIDARGRRRLCLGQIITPQLQASGHLKVRLSHDGKTVGVYVHTLVLETFVRPRPAGKVARHGPGGVQDNRPGNLSWGTVADNNRDKIRDGTSGRGAGRAKLTAAIVLDCRQRYASGEFIKVLAREYGVGPSTMKSAVKGLQWTYLPMPVKNRIATTPRGEQKGSAKLTAVIVRDCRRRHAAGEAGNALAREFGVSSSNMSRILNGLTWAHVTAG